MSFTYPQKLAIVFRDYVIECCGIPELGRVCGKRITKPSECQFDARIGDYWKGEGEENHPVQDGRIQCLECARIKTAVFDQTAKDKSRRILGLTKQGPKAKIRSRGFDKSRRKKFNGTVIGK